MTTPGAGAHVPTVEPARVELRGCRFAYGDREVLGGIDLTLRGGERVALVGPNGSGKSTLLRCVTGVARARLGTVLLDGVPVDELGREQVARRIGVVPQQAVLPFAVRVEELVALGRIPHEHPLLGPREADRRAVRSAIERVGIAHLAARDVRELSLGERQLVLVAMAVAQDASLLILDEPTVHLDLHHQVRVMELLAELNEREGITVLAVLHDLVLASHFFPRVVVLDHGRIAADGAPADAVTGELVRRVFRVDPALVALPA